jgi:hypothetical protein
MTETSKSARTVCAEKITQPTFLNEDLTAPPNDRPAGMFQWLAGRHASKAAIQDVAASSLVLWYTLQDSNLRPSDPKSDALFN